MPLPHLCRPLRLLRLGGPAVQLGLSLCEQPLALRNLAHSLGLELRLPGLQALLVGSQLLGVLLQHVAGRAELPAELHQAELSSTRR